MLLWIIGSIAGLYILGSAVAFIAQHHLIFPGRMLPASETAPTGAERLIIPADTDGDVHAWWFPLESTEKPRPLVVFAHGNFELAIHNEQLAHWYNELGCNVLLVEYRGYDGAPGIPSEHTLGKDLISFVDLVKDHPTVDSSRIIYHGRSIGGGVVGAATRLRPPDALIIESSFTSVAKMATRFGALPFLVRSPFRTIEVLESFEGPVVLIHSERDDLIPYAHARRNLAAAHNATLLTATCHGHNALPGTPEYRELIEQSLETIGWQHPSLVTSEPASDDAD